MIVQATLPFASPEVLTAKRLFPYPLPCVQDNIEKEPSGRGNSRTVSPHDARHDLEALFWCMTYICLTREGPGGKRRKELRPEFKVDNDEGVLQLRRINYFFFSSDEETLVDNKTTLFQENDYDEVIVCHFHPYFEPLKPLMRQWWNILRFAHQYPMFETIHKTLRKTLASTLEALAKQPPSRKDRKKTEKVLKERMKELEELGRPFEHSEFDMSPEESTSAPLDMSPTHDRILHSHSVGSGHQSSHMPSLSPSRPTSRPRKVTRIGGMDSIAE